MTETLQVSGYIYARTNELCDIHDCYKLVPLKLIML